MGHRDLPPPPLAHSVAVRELCAFTAKRGDLDLRFTPAPTAQQGREGHLTVTRRRGAGYEAELRLEGQHGPLRVSGRADGYDPEANRLEEIKTHRGRADAIAPNHRELHWAQAKVYGWLLCATRGLASVEVAVVYFDIASQTETAEAETFSAEALRAFFELQCERYTVWAEHEAAHRRARDAALDTLAFPQPAFRPGQREMARAVYRAATQSQTLRVQAPTGIGKTLAALFPALKAMPARGTDKLFYLTARTPGRQVALDALARLHGPGGRPLRVVELVAKDKSCEHPGKACHGEACPLARGFYDRLPAARQAAAGAAWLDRGGLRDVALAHGVCPYYLGHDLLRWADVVVGDYNHWFDRHAVLHALTAELGWRVSVLVDEAHNLYSRACAMYSADLSEADALAVRPVVPPAIRARVDDWLNQWQLLLARQARAAPDVDWQLLDEMPEDWQRALQRLNSTIAEHLNDHPVDAHGALLPFYFRTLGFAALAEVFGEHSLCELETAAWPAAGTPPASAQLAIDLPEPDAARGRLTLRNVVPAPFLAPRLKAADSLVLFSATQHPADFDRDLLGLPDDTQQLDVPSPFDADRLRVRVHPISTQRAHRTATLGPLVDAMARQYTREPGNYLAFFSSFDYALAARQRLAERHAQVPAWSQERTMDEAARQRFVERFHEDGCGIGFAVLGGVFGEGIDLPGRRLIGAFVATLGFPQFDRGNEAIRARFDAQFGAGRGHDYVYLYPGLQKVVQAAGRVIRTETDSGTLLLLDERYTQARYRALLPPAWRLD